MMEIKEDKGARVLEVLEELSSRIERKIKRLESCKKNSHLHIMMETRVIEKLKEDANEQGVSLAEFCRRKLVGDSQLDRIEKKIDGLKS
jgi:hypothetical protein